ncbi:VCBS domain-containing protein [Azoarcus olearius]|uniref:Cadherin domain-containing protein n=1 Tax=Azoarcus sp. (strain BH72) TaxID=418699 RepID=A1K8L8_AZOSB|nr:VCBS domain-containing protein [Azoarcus olearius]CAL95173.1 hypothetical protein azo2556 [Azoarcus olearius]
MNNKTSPTIVLPPASRAPTSRLVRRSPRPLALEQRFMFDGAAVAEATHVVEGAAAPAADLLSFAADAPAALKAAEALAEQAVGDFLARPDAREQLFALFNGGQSEPSAQWQQAVDSLLGSLADGDAKISVELRSDAELQGALGGFSASGTQGEAVIYLNRDWLDAGAGAEWIQRVLVEELGHALDARLNPGGDTPGDEGQLFAATVLGESTSATGFALDNDHRTLELDGTPVEIEAANLSFVNAYEVNAATTPAGKEANSHDFVFTSLGAAVINDDTNSRYFSGNDVSAVGINIGGQTYYGWVSRPIKVQGVVRGFYFWTDADFTSLAAAQADGNQDGDRNVADNRGFILVVDQAHFDSLGWVDQTANLKNIGSSSDRVDTALNSLVQAYVAPTAVADVANGTPGTSGGAAVEAGGLNNATAGNEAFGNVLTNDTVDGSASKTVIRVGTTTASQTVNATTTSANGTAVQGQYGTLTLGADGSYRYVVDNGNAAVEALRSSSNTLTESFTYTMADGAGGTATTTLTVTIRGANDTPVANNDYAVAKESIAGSGQYGAGDSSGTLATGNVLANDTDPDRSGEEKWVVGVSIEGSATGLSQGTVTFSVTMDTQNTNSINPSNNTYYAYKVDGSTITPLYHSDGVTRVTVLTKSGTGQNIGFTFSDPTAFNGVTRFTVSTSSNAASLGTNFLGTVTNTTVAASTSVLISAPSGTIAVGMSVGGTGLATAPTVQAIQYDGSGNITSLTLSASVALTNQALSFTAAASAGTDLVGRYGVLRLNADGSYVYTPTANNAALAEGQVGVETFTYTMRDAAGATDTTSRSIATLTIRVLGSGSNDPNAVNDAITATEAGGVANGTPGTDPSGNLLDNDTTPGGTKTVVSARSASNSADTAVGSNTQITGRYGVLTLNADGSYSYALNNGDTAVQALRNSSDTLSDTFIYTIENGLTASGNPLRDSATLVVTIAGANDAPVAADVSASATEAGGTGNATPGYNPAGNVLAYVTDVDDAASELRVTAVRTGAVEGAGTAGTVGQEIVGLYGRLTLNANGSWTYVVDNTNPTVNALAPGQTLVEAFNYTVTDRSGTGLSDDAVLTITLSGAEDTVAVNSVFVNEASPYAVFTVSGAEGVVVSLELGNTSGLAPSDTRATLTGPGADIGSQLEYFDGSNWVQYDALNPPALPAGGQLFVRVAVNPDDVHEGNESFTLTATTADGNASIGTGTVGDEGEGEVFLATNPGGTPNAPGDTGFPTLDDDRPTISVSSPTVVEGDMVEFTISIDKLASAPISFTPVFANLTAQLGTDTAALSTVEVSTDGGTTWVALSGAVTIAAGESSVMLRIATVDDPTAELSEQFTLSTGYISGTVANPFGATGTATLTDNDIVPAPVVTPGQSFSYPENRASGFVIGQVAATHPIGVSEFEITAGNADGYFAIDASGNLSLTAAGAAALAAANDYETGANSFTLTVRAREAGGTWSTGVAVTLNLTDLDEIAPVVPPGQQFSYAENRAAGHVIGQVVATDAVGVTAFEITAGNADGYFAIDAAGNVTLTAAGAAALAAANDYETGPNSFTLTVRARDAAGNWSAGVAVTLELTDLDDTAPVIPAGQQFTYAENRAAGHVIGQVVATDAIGVTAFEITAGNGDGYFAIDAAGNVTLTAAGAAALAAANDYETGANSFTLTVRARDAAGNWSAGVAVTLDLTDVAENTAPVEPPPLPEAPVPVPPPVPVPAAAPPEAPQAAPAAPAPFVSAPLERLVLDTRSSALPQDVLTSVDGFRVVVIEAPLPTLSIYRGVADQHAERGASSSFAVPYDAFAHTDPDERIVLSAKLADGGNLPGWVRFDPQSGKFDYDAPDDFVGEMVIKITARDSKGREVSVLFRFTVGEKTLDKRGRAALSEQLRQAAQRGGFAASLRAAPLATGPSGRA